MRTLCLGVDFSAESLRVATESESCLNNDALRGSSSDVDALQQSTRYALQGQHHRCSEAISLAAEYSCQCEAGGVYSIYASGGRALLRFIFQHVCARASANVVDPGFVALSFR